MDGCSGLTAALMLMALFSSFNNNALSKSDTPHPYWKFVLLFIAAAAAAKPVAANIPSVSFRAVYNDVIRIEYSIKKEVRKNKSRTHSDAHTHTLRLCVMATPTPNDDDAVEYQFPLQRLSATPGRERGRKKNEKISINDPLMAPDWWRLNRKREGNRTEVAGKRDDDDDDDDEN